MRSFVASAALWLIRWKGVTSRAVHREEPTKEKMLDEEQVEYARDLATVSHVVIKLLGLVFTLPAVYNLFGSFHQISPFAFLPY
jgi:hypothetical protein